MSIQIAKEVETTKSSIRLDAWRSVFEKTNRILSGEKVTVSITNPTVNMTTVPGWSDGLNIHLNRQMVVEMLDNSDPLTAVLRLKGLNYHELSHVLYTPRMSDELPRKIVDRARDDGDPTWWYAFNALEDQRIETWFTATYGASKRYFEATVLEWIINNGSAEAAVLLCGRKYLSSRIRVQAGRVFIKKHGKELYDEFQTIVDEYITLVLPSDTIKAESLIVRYVKLLNKMTERNATPLPTLVMNDNGACDGVPDRGSESVARQGRALAKSARKARDKASEMIEDAIDDDIEEAEAQAQEKDERDSQNQDSESGDSGAPEDNQSGESGESVDGGGAGSGSSPASMSDLAKEMRDLVESAHGEIEDVQNDARIQQDVSDVLDAVKAVTENGQIEAQGKAHKATTFPSSNSANLAVRKVHTILQRIRQEAEPETLRSQAQGRVDVRRMIARKPNEVDVFQQWNSGHEDETGVEAVILLDVSGSMSHRSTESSTATWALKRAFDKLDIKTTVMVYDTTHEIAYQPTEKAHPGNIPLLMKHGGTNPTSALTQSLQILSKSQSPNKVLVTITDGAWFGDETAYVKLLKAHDRAGVTSLLLGLDGATAYGSHGHNEMHELKSIDGLPKAVLKLVSRLMANSNY